MTVAETDATFEIAAKAPADTSQPPERKIIGEDQLSPEVMKVIEGIELQQGNMNVTDEAIMENVLGAIRRGYPQVHTQHAKPDVIALIAGGPSLNDTVEELREVVYEGAVIVTVNGAHQWAIDRNFKPQGHIVIDARASNAHFLDAPEVPGCRYYLGSQCHSDLWDKVEGREHVGICHAMGPDDEALQEVLNRYYVKRWENIAGGTTVTSRAIGLLRALGYLRFHLFGVDSCFMGEAHHAYDQPENDKDRRLTCHAKGVSGSASEVSRDFNVAPWHLKQLEDFLRFIRINGEKFLLSVHGDGLLAYALQNYADISLEGESNGSSSLDGL